jgi:lipopolysaccharide transport system permease protein
MSKPVTIIEARPKSAAAQFGALWSYRNFYPFLFKELSLKKFRDTVFGMWWLVIRPLVPTLIAVIAFTVVAPVATKGLPYSIFYLSGFMAWTIFQSTMNFTPRCLLWMRGAMRKTYFPRLLVPLASLGPPLIEVAVVAVFLTGTMLFLYLSRGVLYLHVDVGLLLAPLLLLMALLFGLSLGMIASVIAIFVRDVVFTVSYFAQMGMFLSPVLYPLSAIPSDYRWMILVINPMAAIVEGMRWSLTGVGYVDPLYLIHSCAMILLIFAMSLVFFVRAETYFGDVL